MLYLGTYIQYCPGNDNNWRKSMALRQGILTVETERKALAFWRQLHEERVIKNERILILIYNIIYIMPVIFKYNSKSIL